MRLNLKRQGGFTLIEVTIILLVLVILSTIMLPQLGNYNRLARFVKAKEDLIALCASAKKMLDEVMLSAFYSDPNGDDHEVGPQQPIALLVGPGAIPADGSFDPGDFTNVNSGDGWYQEIETGCMEILVDEASGALSDDDPEFDCDYLQNHLQENDPNISQYKNVFDDLSDADHPGLHNTLVGGIFGWRGPYVDALTPDPWGNRYMINTFALWAPPGGVDGDIYSSAVVCYSTGPDQGVDTDFNQPQDNGGGWITGGDDLAVILSAFGPF